MLITRPAMKPFVTFSAIAVCIAFSAIDLATGAIRTRSSESTSVRPTLGMKSVPLKRTLLALDLPLANRIASLREQGPEGYKNLRMIMFDPKSKIDSRWRSTMAVARLGGKLSLPELDRAARADVWELRSASLIAISKIDRERASKWSRKLLKDKALLVRLTAVETLEAIHDRGAVPDLWAQLDNQQNFKRNRSLFIRRRIVEALGKLETSGSESRFVALLEDEDPQVHLPAMGALERLTGRTMGTKTDAVSKRRALWQQWHSSQG